MSDNKTVPESEAHELIAKMQAHEAEKALANRDMLEYNKLMDQFKAHKAAAKAARDKGN